MPLPNPAGHGGVLSVEGPFLRMSGCDELVRSNSGTESVTVGGKQALFTKLKTRTSYTQDAEQVV